MQTVTVRRWQERSSSPDPACLQELTRTLQVDRLTAQLLAQRGGADLTAARDFLDPRLQQLPDPFLIGEMAAAVNRLVAAIQGGEKIAIHGDYDVDGISGTALLVEGLRSFGAEVDYFIPLRLRDGYGLSADHLRQASVAGARVAVSVDCGISAVEEAEVAHELGLDLIITDHHQPPAILPVACAIVNPHLLDSLYPDKELAGVGVAFMLLIALRSRLRDSGAFTAKPEPDLRYSLDLVALGTIADVVPLRGVNRILTRIGLGIINQGRRPGLKALAAAAGIRQVTCGNVAFSLAPRLNAAGRLEDANLGVELLLSSDGARSAELAALLDGFNRERQGVEQQVLAEAIAQVEAGKGGEFSIVLAGEGWHPGVIGIVASRLVERYHRPTVLIAVDGATGKGSARSIRGLHLYQTLQSCAADLAGYGGHAFAAGLSIAAERIDAFVAAFEQAAAAVLCSDDLLPVLLYDGEVLIEELSLPILADLQRLSPFGAGNPEPLFLLRNARAQQVAPCGTGHLKFSIRQGGSSLPCIAFSYPPHWAEFLPGEIDLLVTLQSNEWKDRVSLQLRVKDIRPSELSDN
ncbi:MAG: single-stranded-DNA-specific exonuclease RecJ [Desulfuromonadales bacterium]|nr:single-stranded-DNA-specific exonuclease RecJ [Desulfuromonadales bacterium]